MEDEVDSLILFDKFSRMRWIEILTKGSTINWVYCIMSFAFGSVYPARNDFKYDLDGPIQFIHAFLLFYTLGRVVKFPWWTRYSLTC